MYSPALHWRTEPSGIEGEIGHYQLRSYHIRPGGRLWYAYNPSYMI